MLIKIGKALASLLVILIVAFISFYFWASASPVSRTLYENGMIYVNRPAAYADQKEPGPVFRLMTYNIGFASGMDNAQAVSSKEFSYKLNRESIYKILDIIKPDILLMQEIDFASSRSFDEDQARVIMEYRNFRAAAIAPNYSKNYVPFPYGLPDVNWGRMHSGQTVHSSLPIVNNLIFRLRKPDFSFLYMAFYLERSLQHVVINTPVGKLHVLNVHLEAWDKATREVQAHQILKYYNEIKDAPVILAGDFNVTPHYATVQHDFPDVQGQTDYRGEKTIQSIIEESDLRLAIDKDRYLKDEKHYMTYPSDKPHMRIDFIFGNNHIEFLQSDVVHDNVRGSDHRPVYADFRIK